MHESQKRAMMDALIKLLSMMPISKISVRDIIDECGFNRSTFYYYYADIYALLEDTMKAETARAATSKDYASWQEGFIECAKFVCDNKDAAKRIYESDGQVYFEEYLNKISKEMMIKFVTKEAAGMDVSEDDIKLVSSFYEHALVGTVNEWLQGDMKEDIKEKIKNIGTTFDGSVKAALEKKKKPKDHWIFWW